MNANEQPPISVGGLLDALRRDRNAVPWPQRVDIAKGLEEQFQTGGATADTVALLEFLAADTKPEVRHAVANLLSLLSDADFDRITKMMAGDCHAYVRRSLERAIADRIKAKKETKKRKVGFDQISHQLRTIEDRHGAAAARAAWRLSERYTELLVGSMVHDLRSILTHLRSNASALVADAGKAGTPHKVGKRVKEDIDFLERTVQDMERFTELLSAAKSPQKLLDLVQSAREQAETVVRNDKFIEVASVKVDIAVPAWITVRVVPHLLVPALTNIIKNAFEAFAQPPADGAVPTISVTATADDEWVDLIVRDNGMGFAPEEAAALKPFTPGRRNKTKRNSTGYGLPNAMRNIAAHGGTVHVDSEENRGSTITVRLPLKDAGAPETGDAP